MRRFLLYILALLLPVMVLAQQSRSLEIDAASFKPVNTDPLTGVAIDKIEVDNSLRPCARIKLKINRMTRADIEKVQINVMGGIHDVMKKIVAHEGNGLIIELTAKPQTRFYLHHDKYGDSNEVTLNLEGNKEYRLDAELCVLQTIAINTNVAGAEVYIDGVFKGKTDERCICTIGDMTHGVHKVRVVYGAASNEQDIEINGSSVYFRIEVSIASATPQYVVLSVVPQEAVVLIDGKEYTPDKGVVYTLLNRGTYNYSVSAKDYHTDSGSFTVSDAKVVKEVKLRPAHGWLKVSGEGVLQNARVYVDGALVGNTPLTTDRLASGEHSVRIVKTLYKPFEGKVVITDGKTLDYAPSLVADFATVSLNVGGECDIYVNNEKKGRGSWSGDLASGTYIFEARKAGYTTSSITKTISAEPRQQSYTLPAPQPILGKLNVTSSPAMADVYVDGKVVGQTPLMVDLVVGKHEVSLRKGELGSEKQSVNITEGQTANLNLTLAEINKPISISYTTNDNSKVKLKREAFDAKVISHTYEKGVGTILFEKQITKIGNSAFANCDVLTSITIPNSVTSIGDDAFYSCDGLTSITIPNSVTSIGERAFFSCKALKEFKGKFASSDGRCLIVDGVLNSFAPSGLTSYIIPNGVTSIGEYAFRYCFDLTSITIPNSVTSIGDRAFYGCDGLTSITIPNSITSIGSAAFASCKALKEFKGKFASSDGRCLIVKGVLNSFAPSGLTTYAIPNSVTSIGSDAFCGCTSLTSITIPNSVTSIGDFAFWSCDGLTSITIPNSVTSIGDRAFYGCDDLTSITIPNSVTSIGKSAFSSCDELKEFKGKFASTDGRCLIVDGVLNSFAPSGLTSYIIPNDVTSIGDSAFSWCRGLTSVTIGHSVTSIGNSAFSWCRGLKSITIPNSVTSIGDSAFDECSALTCVYCKATTPPTLGGSYVFDKNGSNRIIYVPTSSVSAYKSASCWSKYASSIVGYDF